jgi:hypothetical protein
VATVLVTPSLAALIVLDVVDDPVRRWFDDHDFTTSALVSVLVLLITTLVVDRVVRHRQLRERAQVIAAQAAIVVRQARQATDLVGAAIRDGSQRDPASDELRTLMTMLLLSAPILIDASPSRAFLESAQRLAALLSSALRVSAGGGVPSGLDGRLERSRAAVDAAARPLVAVLDLDQLAAVDGDGDPGGRRRLTPGSHPRGSSPFGSGSGPYTGSNADLFDQPPPDLATLGGFRVGSPGVTPRDPRSRIRQRTPSQSEQGAVISAASATTRRRTPHAPGGDAPRRVRSQRLARRRRSRPRVLRARSGPQQQFLGDLGARLAGADDEHRAVGQRGRLRYAEECSWVSSTGSRPGARAAGTASRESQAEAVPAAVARAARDAVALEQHVLDPAAAQVPAQRRPRRPDEGAARAGAGPRGASRRA